MQVVIDIPEEIYIHLSQRYKYQNADDTGLSELDKVGVSIKNGITLPEGHGRLGDLDALREEVSSWGMNDYEPSDFIDEIDRAATIIEAESED